MVGGRLVVDVGPDGDVSIEARLHGALFPDGDTWVSICYPLDISTCGDTKEQAIDRIKDAVSIFFETCIARKTLNKALVELGWEMTSHNIIVDGLTSRCMPMKKCKEPELLLSDFQVIGNTWHGAATVHC